MTHLPRQLQHRVFAGLGLMAIAIGPLSVLLMGILAFKNASFSAFTALAGPLFLSIGLTLGTLAIAFPIALIVAINLSEMKTSGYMSRLLPRLLPWLQAIPAPVWGLVGLTLFVLELGLSGPLAVSLTLGMMLIPPIALAITRALKSVPWQLRQAGIALGASRFELIRRILLPTAMPRLVEVSLLASARALGEAAVLVMISHQLGPENAVNALPMALMGPTLFPVSNPPLDTATAAALLWVLVLALTLTAYKTRRTMEKNRL